MDVPVRSRRDGERKRRAVQRGGPVREAHDARSEFFWADDISGVNAAATLGALRRRRSSRALRRQGRETDLEPPGILVPPPRPARKGCEEFSERPCPVLR